MARLQLREPAATRGVFGHQIVAEIVLSERNLLALLTKLYTEGSACEIENNHIVKADGSLEPNWKAFKIRGEHDAVHYSHVDRQGAGPGQMHPLTEILLHFMRDLRDGNVVDTWSADPDISRWEKERGYLLFIPAESYEQYREGL